MSIKDLFDRSTNYVPNTSQKDAFSDAESSRNVEAISEKHNTFEPQIDYNEPLSFARFGSAELYYQSAIDRIIDFYPYDGSDAEYNEFFNKSLGIEKYIFNNLYPRTNGYVNFSTSSISLKGGPHTIDSDTTKGLFKDPESSQRETANIYDENIYTTAGLPTDYGEGTRESNLKCDFTKGVTVEFWLKNGEIANDTKQALFHLTNSVGGDEFTLYLSGTTASSPFFTTLSASNVAIFGNERIGTSPTTTSILDWNHYAISFKNQGNAAGIITKFYLNGKLDHTTTIGSAYVASLEQSGTIAHIASGSAIQEHLFFTGSMDEFRFWKTERTAQDIGRNWFGQVRGGANTDISNTTLGVYYKFNEGITGDTTIDNIVLDYSGRISNGTFNGYTVTSRNTGSAIVSASAATSEYLDPIIYSTHPSVSSLKTDLVSKGVDHDLRNNAAFFTFMPSWVSEEHEELGNTNFKYLNHIVGSYFDKLYLQIEAVSSLKSPIYTSASHKPISFAKHLPPSMGLQSPEIFVDSSVMEKFLNRSETQAFENDLDEIKNLIYLNLYNNVTYLFKSKGTEKAVRNVLRAFNIDDKLIRLNTYANNYVYELENNLKQTILRKSSVNFNKIENLGAVIYSSASADSTQLGYISGSGVNSHELRYGFTQEADIVFPKFVRLMDKFERDFTRVSLFGIHSASSILPQTEVFDPSFYVYAQRDEAYSKNVKFVLSSSVMSSEISSSLYHDVYDDESWNLAIRIKPNTIGLTGSVAAVSETEYTVEFSGYNQRLGEIRNSFNVSSSATKARTQNFLSSSKRVFVGAHRTNVTGALQHKSDTLCTATRYWTRRLDDHSLKQHAYDFENYGIKDANKHLSPLDQDNSKTLNIHTLALNYEFGNVTGSDSSGGFTVIDISSGSADGIAGAYGKLGEISGYLYPGIGFGFATSSSDVVLNQQVNSHQFINPELAISDNLVQIKTDDDKLFDSVDTIPNYHYILEKSMYAAISEEMLNFLAGVNDFHNLIGHPVHQYRMEYKGLNKLREIFFRKVSSVKEIEKFIDYYKWFDDSVSQIIEQLIPASADYTPDILNTIESHVLERNKYQYRIPMMALTSSTEGVAFGAEEMRYNWNRNHAPIDGLQANNSNWWKERAEREGTISSGDLSSDKQREQIKKVITNQTNGDVGRSFTAAGAKYSRSNFKYRTLSKGNIFESKKVDSIRGGVNFVQNKDIHYTYTALHPAGPITTEDGVFVPRNVLIAFTEDFAALEDSNDSPENPSAKIKRNVLVQHGRDWEDGIGYKNTKSSFSFPFNIISSSVTTGFNKQVVEGVSASVEITNLHNDVYGPDMERPMQGTFTSHVVGGHQSRHVKLNTGGDNYLNRPEAWKILLGRNCNVLSGAIGMVGADYPYPEANELGVSPYPLTGAQKAVLFRDELAKRPVNVRNIQHTTGSTILGNYEHNYQVVHAVGGHSNPRAFIDEQPTIPTKAVGADTVKTILDIERGQNGHFVFMDDYNAGYLTGSGDYKNKTIIVNRFSAPGSFESMAPAFRDIRSGDMSVYNSVPYRNMTVRRPFQGVTSSIVSQGTGIRNFDHTGRAFGLTNLAARHASRFYRDSVFQPDTNFSNVPRNTPDLESPGKADDAFTELPSFHKIHRNNLLKPREVETTTQVPSSLNLTNAKSLYFTDAGPTDGVSAAAASAAQVASYLTSSRANGSTFSAWVRTDPGRNSHDLFSVGRSNGSAPFVDITKVRRGSSPVGHALRLVIQADNGGSQTGNQWDAVSDSALSDGNIHHIVVSFDTTVSGSGVDFYVDGTKLTTVEISRNGNAFFTEIASSYDFRGFGNVSGETYYTLGNDSGANNGSSNRLSGSMDQVTLWTRKLSDAEVENLYNGGNPYNITASTVYLGTNTPNLHAWWTFESSNGDVIQGSNPGSRSALANTYNDSSGNNYHLFAVAKSGESIDQTLSNALTPAPVNGDNSTTSQTTISYTCDGKFDNLNQTHQIPRSDRQYSWIAHSITHTGTCEPRYSGFMQVNSPIAPYYEITGNYYPFFDYVSASFSKAGFFQNTTRLNIFTIDPTGSEINTLGVSPISGAISVPSEGTRLNSLLIRRGDTYGWNWRAHRMHDHPILDREHKENLLTAVKGTTIKEFRLPPVSMKGRPVVVNMDIDGENVSLKTTHNNEKIYFNERELNDLVFEKEDTTLTPLDQLLEVSRQQGSNLNWVHYSETLFPSRRNEFSSGSRERLGYDNKFWRDSQDARVILGQTFNNSFNRDVVQSSWILDPQQDFLTRTDVVSASGAIILHNPSRSNKFINRGMAGELQNNYFHYVSGTYIVLGAPRQLADNIKVASQAPGALYSRKQLLTSPNSVVSRTGFAQTASLTHTFTDKIGIGAGEALWEAGTQATINIKSGDSFVTSSSPSEPWFDEYGDFREELQLVAKDYAVVPEFRISEHISDYVKGGTFNKTVFDAFELHHTDIDSSQQNFYKDYSNSDFLKEFASIKDKSGLSAKEIMLTCKAAVRFNPYKGFYPAQRTIDLTSQFSSSFAAGFAAQFASGSEELLESPELIGKYGGALRPILQPLFAPGILYNSIKSGIAVDYPILNNDRKIQKFNFTGSGADPATQNYMLLPASASLINKNDYNPNNPYWDLRVPFETMIEPGKFIDKIQFLDFEPHPSASINVTASLDTSVSDGIYELMAKNFFGQTGDFFLKDSSYTKIQSDLIQDGLRFKDGDVFAARLKIRKSHNGNRFYNLESGSDGTNNYFSTFGASAFSGTLADDTVALAQLRLSGSFPLPQDPAHTGSGFQETFTMYSRPTAFGPSVSGRNSQPERKHSLAFSKGTLDALEGYNWAYTPPYYHGESWVDFVFRPTSTKTYTLEDILTETEAVYWRADPGQISGSIPASLNTLFQKQRLLIDHGYVTASLILGQQAPYGGSVINKNAMQLDSSLNLFGVERVPKKRKDKFGNTILDENELAGKRWVIQPKWETPMLNFANVKYDSQIPSSEDNNITYPTNFKESVPRGMWHQFGVIPTDPKTGIFLEIDDIPTDWLRFHYDVINFDSVYNNNDHYNSGSTAHKDIQSLTDLFGFQRSQKKDSAKVRLGEIADKREVYEAVVAIPYIVEANEDYENAKTDDDKTRKKFISIPRQRFSAALKEREGSQDGDSLQAAGESIRKMVQKMKRYVLPPQFDFINFDEIDPIAMYFFEFKYEFDKDDLSYIWQNLAPRDYKKITFQEAKVAHDLMNNELLDEDNLMDNPNLRWMVFKVKQKAKKDYYDLIPPQVKAARQTTILDKAETDKDDEYLQFNWPYDYLSFVELVKLEADVLYKADDEGSE